MSPWNEVLRTLLVSAAQRVTDYSHTQGLFPDTVTLITVPVTVAAWPQGFLFCGRWKQERTKLINLASPAVKMWHSTCTVSFLSHIADDGQLIRLDGLTGAARGNDLEK